MTEEGCLWVASARSFFFQWRGKKCLQKLWLFAYKREKSTINNTHQQLVEALQMRCWTAVLTKETKQIYTNRFENIDVCRISEIILECAISTICLLIAYWWPIAPKMASPRFGSPCAQLPPRDSLSCRRLHLRPGKALLQAASRGTSWQQS